ncbi:MAG: ATP-binding protein [Gammaproteobacteria bacterium]|nr:ATP-binding protein [Gammaproteobacteria bacterium]MDH5731853.1 ATP-binding protein [Gammaproteobacteria bacterium]
MITAHYFQSISIKSKILLIAGICMIGFAMYFGFNFVVTKQNANHLDMVVNDLIPTFKSTDKIFHGFETLEKAFTNSVAMNEPDLLNEADDIYVTLLSDIEILNALNNKRQLNGFVSDAEQNRSAAGAEAATESDIRQLLQAYYLQAKLVSQNIINQKYSESSSSEIALMQQHRQNLLNQIQLRQKSAHQNFINTINIAETNSEQALWLGGALGVCVISAIILFFFLIGRDLTSRLSEIVTTIKKMQTGDLKAKVLGATSSNDEIGVLAKAFNNMSDSLSETTVSKNYIENILSSMAESLFVINHDGLITRTNLAAEKLLACSANEIVGKGLKDFFMDMKLCHTITSSYLKIENKDNIETIIQQPIGRKIPVELSISSMTNVGSSQDLILNVRDISIRKRDQNEILNKTKALEASNKTLDQFAYVVSHDLKAPLRAISNLSSWIEEDLNDVLTDETREQMTLLRGRVMRLEALINGILEYSRIGRISSEIMTVDTRQLLDEIVLSLATPQEFSIEIADDMPKLEAAAIPMSQVFSNLLSNAIKYRSSDHGHVTINVRERGDFFVFTVKDDGPGIDPQFHEKVFEIFQTLAARDKFESTGVGLSLVKRIVEDQGGAIQLDSSLGHGASFEFTWPKFVRKGNAA